MLGSLMAYCKEEDSKTLELIYKKYKNRMFYTAFLILKEKQEAENVVHDTFIVLADHLEKIADAGSARTWNYIATILKNKCYDCRRKQSRIVCSDDDVVLAQNLEKIAEDGLEEKAIARDLHEQLVQLVMELKFPYKEVLYLQYFNELSSREIGEILSLTPENVRQISGRARKTLKKKLTEMGYGNDGQRI